MGAVKLAKVPAGVRILVDANILLYALARQSEQCRAFLGRCASGEVEGWVTTTVVAEVGHRRMMMEAQAAGLVRAHPAKELGRKPEAVRKLTVSAEEVRALLGGGLRVEPVLPGDFLPALELQQSHGLLTNDSLNLAAARRLGLKNVATADPQFDRIPGLSLYRPEDVG